jgi:crossover junction endodeoxyribonuclease RuvC
MVTKYILGIDPGIKGAVAVLTHDGKLVEVWDMPTLEVKVGKSIKNRISPELLSQELRNWDVMIAYMEAVSASPQMGVTSAFAFGEGFGIVKGVLSAMGIPLALVPPAKWKRDMNLNAAKDGSRAKAIAMWPNQAGEFKRAKDDGRAESALIGAWGIANSSR